MSDINNSTNDTLVSGNSYDSNNIYNTGNNVTITGEYRYSSDYDYIDNSGSNVEIYAYAHADEIINRAGGSNSFIDTGDGDDKVTNYGRNTTIYSGYGNDTITTYGNATISAGAGDDTIVIKHQDGDTISHSIEKG